MPDRVEQIFGHAAALEDQPHEREERDRQQRFVEHDAEDSLRQRLEELRLQQAQPDADEPEEQPVGAQGERERISDQQEDEDTDEHERSHVRDEQLGHGRGTCSVVPEGPPEARRRRYSSALLMNCDTP